MVAQALNPFELFIYNMNAMGFFGFIFPFIFAAIAVFLVWRLRSVLGLAKPELRTQESWTYQLRQKGGA